MLSVQLIQPAKNQGYISNSRSGCYTPLGLVSIATYVRQEFPNAKIEVLDGELMTNQEIIGQLKPNSFVGIDTKTVNYASALEIAYAAKSIGSIVVLGGVYASAIPEKIIEHRRDIIDHIIVGYGEKPFEEIISGNGRDIMHNPKSCFNEIPIPDRSTFLDLESYISNFQREHPTWHPRGTNIFTHMGCMNRCVFCSRTSPNGSVYYRNPSRIWEEVSDLVKNHNVRYIVDFSETITNNMNWLKELVDEKPKDLNPIFHSFTSASGVNDDSIELMKNLNVKHIFMGLETGDEDMACQIMKGKKFSPDVSLNAVKLLTEAEIGLTPSFVLGLPGETEESLQNTYEFAKKVYEITNFEEIFCSALIPFPGSIAFNMLDRKIGFTTDIHDPEELKKQWTKHFCETDYETIMKYAEKILALGKYTITIKKTNPIKQENCCC